MNLETTYLGLRLRTPLVVSSSPLSGAVENIRHMEDAGASAVVLYSLFEEQLRNERHELHWNSVHGTESHPEALTYVPEPHQLWTGPELYLRHIERAKKAVSIPIIASLNGNTPGGWIRFARDIERAGADALELNLYSLPTEMDVTGAELEKRYLETLAAVRAEVSLPLAVKLSPYFTNFAHFAGELDKRGANALVLFNRFYQPDIELEALEVSPHILLSSPMAMRLPLRWIAILYDRVAAALAATGGIHKGTDALKMLMAGADAVTVCSVLMRYGIDRLQVIEKEMAGWMESHGYKSVEQLKGSMSHKNCPDPTAFERAQYMRAVGIRRQG